MLYHVSETPDIARFDPRPPPGGEGSPVVWAVDGGRLRNYLLPRDCPRVTFYAGPRTSPGDAERFFGSSAAVVAIEAGWVDRVRRARLFCYALPEDPFRCVDAGAGYFQSVDPVTPIGIEVVDDAPAALAARGVEVRLLPSLWDLHDAVAASTLTFSIIRMRNAAPRPVAAPPPTTMDAPLSRQAD